MNRFFLPSFRQKQDLVRPVVLGLLIILPLIGDDYLIVQLTQFVIYGIFAMGLSLVWGYAGILCFGQAVFFGLGAYIMALATKNMIPGIAGFMTASVMAISLSVVVVAFFAAILGYFLFYGRLSGPYLGIVTLAIAVIAERIAVKWYYIGGFNGLINVPPLSIAGWEIIDQNALYYVIVAIGFGVYLFCDRIVRSPFGTILAAVRSNEVRAEFFGYNIARYKIIIFAVGAAVAGLAGALFAAVTEFVSPTMLGFGLSTEVLIWVALGGKEVLLASFLGAMLVRMLEAFLSDLLTYYWILILGMFFVICVMFFPKGVFGNLLTTRPRQYEPKDQKEGDMREKIKWMVVLAVILSLAVVLPVTAAKEPIKIGVVLPLSGGFEIYGNLGVRGAKMAVAEINAAGGVLDGRPLELIIEDNKTDPKTAVEKAKKLILRDKVVAVMGPVSSAARDAMTPVAEKYKTPLLYGIDYEGGVCNRYVFLYSAIPDHDMDKLIPYMAEKYGKSFYIFGYDYVWPHKMTEAIKRNVDEIGGEIVGIEYTPFGVKDYAPTIQKISKSGAKILMLIVPGADGFTFIKQFTDFGLKDKIKIVALASDENYLLALTPDQSEGIFTALPFLASLKKAEANDFVTRQQEMFGPDTVVTWATGSHYGLVMLLKDAIEKAGSDDREKIVDNMGDLTITVGNGPETMRASDHHMILNMLIGKFTGGELVVEKDLGAITPSDQCAGKSQ